MSDGQVIRLRLSLMGRPVRNYSFEKPSISIGRDPAADVYVDNPGVSRDHFKLERGMSGLYQVVDLGSANGRRSHREELASRLLHLGIGDLAAGLQVPDPAIRLEALEDLHARRTRP